MIIYIGPVGLSLAKLEISFNIWRTLESMVRLRNNFCQVGFVCLDDPKKLEREKGLI